MIQLNVMAGSIISDVLSAVDEVTGSVVGETASGWISDGLQWVLNNTIFRLLYWVAAAFCWLIGILYDMFEVMAGLVKVSYDGQKNYLINIFFANSSVTRVYWGMAMIGFALCFAFTILAVIKKMFDIEGKMQQSLGMIIGNCVKSILMICLMSAFMTALLNMSNVLIQQVMYVFNNSEDLGKEQEITYTDEEYAAMARVLSTIGNYSLNPSWTSRYNINSCFNDFREDLQWLYDQRVFDVYYDENIIGSVCWQSELQRIVYTADLTKDQPLDVYNENLTLAIEHTVEVMQTNRNFVPISSYKRTAISSNGSVPLDRVLFLASTMRAANNDAYNKDASFTDALRGPYYNGDKSIYDFDTVSADFNIGMATDYILLFLVGWIMVKDLTEIIFTCVSRIFNMILLYLISPPLIAATPLDGGNKLRQWITAMVVQSFGVFGTIISMRIMMLLIPVMLSDKLILFDNVFLNILGKVILIMGAMEVEKKAQGLITGILADNAGMQAINAGDMKETAGKFLNGAASAGMGALKAGFSTAKGAAKVGWGAAKLGGKGIIAAGKGAVALGNAVGNGMINAGGWMAKKAGNSFDRDSGAGGFGGSGGDLDEGIEMQDLSGKFGGSGSNGSGGAGSSGGGSLGGGTADPKKAMGGEAGRDGGKPGENAAGTNKAGGSANGGNNGADPKKAMGGEAGKDAGKPGGNVGGTGKAGGSSVDPKKAPGSGSGKDGGKPGGNTGTGTNGKSTGKGGKKPKQKYDPLSNPGPNNEALKFSGKKSSNASKSAEKALAGLGGASIGSNGASTGNAGTGSNSTGTMPANTGNGDFAGKDAGSVSSGSTENNAGNNEGNNTSNNTGSSADSNSANSMMSGSAATEDSGSFDNPVNYGDMGSYEGSDGGNENSGSGDVSGNSDVGESSGSGDDGRFSVGGDSGNDNSASGDVGGMDFHNPQNAGESMSSFAGADSGQSAETGSASGIEASGTTNIGAQPGATTTQTAQPTSHTGSQSGAATTQSAQSTNYTGSQSGAATTQTAQSTSHTGSQPGAATTQTAQPTSHTGSQTGATTTRTAQPTSHTGAQTGATTTASSVGAATASAQTVTRSAGTSTGAAQTVTSTAATQAGTSRRTSGSSGSYSMPGKKVTDGSDPLSRMSKRPSKVPPVIKRDK